MDIGMFLGCGALVLTSAVSLGVATQMRHDVLAARLELLVLRASLPHGVLSSRDSVLLPPSTTPVTTEEAAESLANRPKPLQCSAQLSELGVVAVSCSDLFGEEALQHELNVRAWDGEWDEDGGVKRYLFSDESSLLVYGRDESLHIERSAFEKWYRDYETSNPVGFAFRMPTSDERRAGANYVMIADWIDRDPARLPFPLGPFRP